MVRTFLFYLWLCASVPVYANDFCTRVFANAALGLSASENFWNEPDLAWIQTPTGPKAFAFGFDAEMWHISDIISLIASDPQAKALAEQNLKRHHLQYGHKRMANYLGYQTVGEFRDDALLPGAVNKPTLTVFDLKPSHYQFFEHGHKEKTLYAKPLNDAVTLVLRNRGIPVESKFEEVSGSREQGSLGNGSAVELIQKGSMTNKRQFRDLILNFLYKEVAHPETHFHVSVPSDAVTPKQMLLAARALEAKMTMEEVLEKMDYDGTLYPYDWSAIVKPWSEFEVDGTVERGVVRVTPNRWETPYKAHDVEIRMWFDAKHGLENMHFMMELVKNANRLRDTSDYNADHTENVVPANLNASLRYSALLLKDRLPADKKFIADDLERFAKGIETSGKIPTRKLQTIARYFREHDVLNHLTMETFLEPAPLRGGGSQVGQANPGRPDVEIGAGSGPLGEVIVGHPPVIEWQGFDPAQVDLGQRIGSAAGRSPQPHRRSAPRVGGIPYVGNPTGLEPISPPSPPPAQPIRTSATAPRLAIGGGAQPVRTSRVEPGSSGTMGQNQPPGFRRVSQPVRPRASGDVLAPSAQRFPLPPEGWSYARFNGQIIIRDGQPVLHRTDIR